MRGENNDYIYDGNRLIFFGKALSFLLRKSSSFYTLADTLHRSPSTSRRVLAFLCPSQCREGGVGGWPTFPLGPALSFL